MLMNQFLSNPRPRASRLDFIRRVWRDHELSCVKLCDLLEESLRMNDHVEAGCGRFDDFAENEFGVPARQAWTFVHLGQRLVELPETRKALLYGIIGYTKAREFASIATVDTERADGAAGGRCRAHFFRGESPAVARSRWPSPRETSPAHPPPDRAATARLKSRRGVSPPAAAELPSRDLVAGPADTATREKTSAAPASTSAAPASTRRELGAATEQTLCLTPEEELAF